MKQFLILLFTALLAVSCNSKDHQEKDLISLNDVNKRDYFYTPSSFGFMPFNPDYSEVVRNAITDSLNLDASILMNSDSLKIVSVKNLQLSNDLSVDIHSKIYIEHDEYIDAMIDTLVFKNPSGANFAKSVRDISKNHYNTIVNHINQSRTNLFGLIERVCAPHIPLCHKPACSTHKKSKDAIQRAREKDDENVKNGRRTKSNTFFNVALPTEIDINLLKEQLEEEFVFNIQTQWALVSGNLDDEFILSVYGSQKGCIVSFKLITILNENRLYSYITGVETDIDFVNSSCNRVVEFYKNDLRERLLLTLQNQISTEMSIELPADYDKYSRLVANHVQYGDYNPVNTVSYVTKTIRVRGASNEKLYNLTKIIANELWPYSEPIRIVNFQVVDSTAYVEFDIHKNGFTGVSVWLARIEPLVKRNLMRNNSLLKDVFFESPPSASQDVINLFS